MNLGPIAVLSAGVVLLASVGLVVPAQASTLALSPVVGNGFKTTVQSQFGLRLSHPSNVSTDTTLRLGTRIQDSSGGLDAVDGAQVVMPNGIRYNLSGGQARSNSFAIAPKTIHPGGLVTTDLNFTLAASPYRIESRLEIAPSATLTVEAGVVLDFLPSTQGAIWAQGNVFMNGTAANPIKVGYASSWQDLFKTTDANNNTIDLKGVHFFGNSNGSAFGSVYATTVLIEDCEFYDIYRFGWFYSSSQLRIKRSVLSNAGDINIWSSTGSLLEDNLFIYRNSTPLASYTSSLSIKGNDFSKLENAPLRFYANADLSGNYWGTTNPELIATFILDGTKSLEYGSALADYSLPLAEPSAASPERASFTPIASYLQPHVRVSQFPTLVLKPAANRSAEFGVVVTSFVDAGSLDGLISEGEQTEAFGVQFSELTFQALEPNLQVSGSLQGTSLSGYLNFGPGVKTAQVDPLSFGEIQVLNQDTGTWSNLTSLQFYFQWGYATFEAEVPPIQDDIYLRLAVGDSFWSFSLSVSQSFPSSLTISAPFSVLQGATARFDIQVRNSAGSAVRITDDSIAKLSYEYVGPGLPITSSQLTTDFNGRTSIFVLIGANDLGAGLVTITLDPDGDLGSREPVVTSTAFLIIPAQTMAVEEAETGDTYILNAGFRQRVAQDAFPQFVSRLGDRPTVSAAYLSSFTEARDFAGVLRNASSGAYFFTDDTTLEKLDDCFLAAQFDIYCSENLFVSNAFIRSLADEFGVDVIQNKTFPDLGQMLTPTLEIQGTPAVGQNLSLRITGVQAGGYSSLRWLRLTTPEVVLRQDRVTYTVQPADLGQPIAVEMTVSKPRYESKTVRSDVVTAAQTATPITWTPAPGPVVIVPELPVRPSPSGLVNPDIAEADSLATGDTDFRSWTKRLDTNSAKVYGKDLIGAGKVQFFHNGREIAWARANSEEDPKLFFANDTPYLVRTVFLEPGKNVIEIWLNGVRVTRVAYTL